MAHNDILGNFSSSDIKHFKKDFFQMIKIGGELDRYYGEVQHTLDTLIPRYEKLLTQFNKKYKGIRIKTKKTIDEFKVRLFVKEKNAKDFFTKSASRISGLKFIGRTNFDQADISDAEKFSALLDSLSDKVYLSYADPQSGTSTVAAVYDKKEKMIELIYDLKEILNENSASFKLCAFYALQEGFNKKIEIYGDASTFGFSDLLDEKDRREWYDKFNPNFGE